jgi:predicted nucleotidyltransferase
MRVRVRRKAGGNRMSAVEWTIDGLPDETQRLLRSYVKDVVRAYGEQLDAVLLFGSAVRGEFLPGRSNLNIVLFVPSYDVALLKAYAAVHKKWNKEQVVVPLFLTKADLQASAFVFPLEYQDIQECHRLLWGQDPFIGFKVDQRHLAGEVLQALRGNLVRMRQRLVEGGGAEEAMMLLLPLSITALLPVLRGVQRLLARPVLSQGEPLLKDIEAHFEIDLSGLQDALSIKRGHISPGRKEVPRAMDRYLDNLGRLVDAVERQVGRG